MSTSIQSIDDVTYINERRTVPVGTIFEGYDDGDRKVSVGDMVYFNDPDAGLHAGQCELVGAWEAIGYVSEVYAFDPDYRDEVVPQVGISGSPVGRLDPTDNYVTVVPTDGGVGVRGHPLLREVEGRHEETAKQLADRLHKSDEYHSFIVHERHDGRGSVPEDFIERSKANICQACLDNDHSRTYVNGK